MSADHQARGGVSEAEVGPSLWLEHRANGSYLVRRSGDVSACLAMLSKEEAAALEAAAQVRAGQDHGGGAVGPSYRALVEFYDAHVGTPCEEVRHRATVRELHRRAQKAEGQIARGGREYLLKRLASYIGRTSRQRKLLAAAEARAAKAVEVLQKCRPYVAHHAGAISWGGSVDLIKQVDALLSDNPTSELGVEAGEVRRAALEEAAKIVEQFGYLASLHQMPTATISDPAIMLLGNKVAEAIRALQPPADGGRDGK